MTHQKQFRPALSRLLVALTVAATLVSLGATAAKAQALATFAVLSGAAVTNTGPSVINGNLGVYPGSSITGFPPGIVTAPYTIYQTTAVAAQAQSDLTTAYNLLAAQPFTADLSGQDLGGMTLTPGVYNFDTTAQLTGTLTLDAQGDPNAVFVFNVGSTLTTASASSVVLINGADAANVYYRVGSSATLGAATLFQGNILALTSITLITASTIDCGSALARNGAVTLDTNTITVCTTAGSEPIGDGLDGGGTATGGTTPPATAVAGGIDGYVANGGILPLGFQVLGVLTPAELAAALNQLSGEIGTAFAPTAFDSMDGFLTLMEDHSGPGVVRLSSNDNPNQPGTVSAMGYAAEPAPAPQPAAFADIGGVGIEATQPLWELWTAVHGGQSVANGDASLGTHDRTSRDYGLAIGVDYRVAASTKVGLAIGIGGTDFRLPGTAGTGRSDVMQVAVSGQTDFGAAYLSGALAYAYHRVTTERFVTFAGLDQFTAQFDAHDLAAEVEAGYHVGIFTPFAGLQAQALYTPAYSETTASGNSTFALSYGAQTAVSLRSEVGIKADWSTEVGDNTTLGLHASAAWAHYYMPATSIQASFQALPGSSFTTVGAPGASDALLLSAVAEIGLGSGLTLGGSVNGAFAPSAYSIGGALKLGYQW